MTENLIPGVAIVTGGASGIGLATTQLLLEQGWKVSVFDFNPEALAKARAQLNGFGENVRFAEADVTDESRIEQLIADTVARLGPIKGVVTSAGIARDVPFLETTAQMFRAIHEVNVIGTFVVCRAAAAHMKDNGGGSIVTLASVSGLTGNIGRAAYGSSKGAIVNLTRIMAVELGRYGIRVNSVAPGPVETPMAAAIHGEAIRQLWVDKSLLSRYGKPDEIAQAIAFLLDAERSSYITGQILAVDGGFMAAGIIDRARG